jgi:hypothetical protein
MKQSQSQFANCGKISKGDATVLHPTGREGASAADRNALAAQELDAAPTTQRIDAHFDSGSGEEETPDGLDAEAEAVRQAAEAGALDRPEDEDVPVFDRANRSELL